MYLLLLLLLFVITFIQVFTITYLKKSCFYGVVLQRLRIKIPGVYVLLFTMLNVLYHYISAFRSMCAVSNIAVCYSPLISCFSGMFLRYCLNDTEMVPVAPVVTGIISVFTFHMRCSYIVRSIYTNIYIYILYIYTNLLGLAVRVQAAHPTCQ